MSNHMPLSTKPGFFQNDDYSNSAGRLNGTIVVILGILTTVVGLFIIIMQAFELAKSVNTGVLFTAGPALITLGLSYLGYHKTQETIQLNGGNYVRPETTGFAGGGSNGGPGQIGGR
jgi:heme/copper-type cytochrome/quinol oxidase subunit 2